MKLPAEFAKLLSTFNEQKKVNAQAPCNKPNKFTMWYGPATEASFMVDQMGVLLSWLEANHKVLCLHRMITQAGMECMDFITFDGCNMPGESQELATN